MNGVKKIMSLVFILGILFFAFGASAEGKCGFSKISYYDSEDMTTEITSLSPGRTITAKITVSGGTETKSLTFISVLYDGSKLIDAGYQIKECLPDGTDYEVILNIPEDIVNPRINSFIWESIKGMDAVYQSSTFPSDDARLAGLTVVTKSETDSMNEGEQICKIDGFTHDIYEYELEIPASQKCAPLIEYKTYDSGADVKVANPETFPGEALITVLSPDGTKTSEYKIRYTSDNLFVKDINVLSEDANIVNAYFYEKNFNAESDFYTNRNYWHRYVNPEIEGMDYISSQLGGSLSKEAEFLKFTLERPATIHIIKRAANTVLTEAGFEVETLDVENDGGYSQGWVYVDFNYELKDGEYVRNTQNRNDKYCAFAAKHSRHFDAGTVAIPGSGGDDGMLILIEYDNNGNYASR